MSLKDMTTRDIPPEVTGWRRALAAFALGALQGVEMMLKPLGIYILVLTVCLAALAIAALLAFGLAVDIQVDAEMLRAWEAARE